LDRKTAIPQRIGYHSDPLTQTSQPQQADQTRADEYPRRYGDRYVLLRELGAGGMGHVYMAVTGGKDVARVCALKIIRQLDTAGRSPQELGRRFVDEARVVTKLSHENLVYVFDFGLLPANAAAANQAAEQEPDAGGDSAYLAMEYLRGKTLTEMWNRCALKRIGVPVGVSLFVVAEIAAGLGYAHTLPDVSLVHRDVSPSNVMLTYTGGVKLIDFGLAQWSQKASHTASGVNWGKLSYMSPEQALGRAIDHRSDVYSLGVILWELLTGRQLFPSEESRRATLQITPPSQINPTISTDLDAIVLRALAGDLEDRYENAAAFSRDLMALIPRDATKPETARFVMRLFESDAVQEQEEEKNLLARATALHVAAEKNTQDPENGLTEPGGIAAARDPMIGNVLADRYFIKRKIGEGSMGLVYEGHHTGVGKRVAIKIPHRSERRREKLMQRFRLEANAASQIGHPNIADVTDCGTTPGGDFFFVMEYVDGVDLSKVLRRSGGLPLDRCLLIAIQICRGLEAAHKAGIIHRDLKPSNVMLVRDREDEELVKVLDFGVAKFLRQDQGEAIELTMADATVGTPRYMAPEQIESGKGIDFRVDTYAVGGLIYAMLSGGRAPFESESIHELWRRKTNEEPPSISKVRSDLPDAFTQLTMRCLARDPAKRPQSMEELKRQLVRLLEEVRQAGSSIIAMRAPSETSKVDAVGADTDKSTRPPGNQTRSVWLVAAVGIVLLGGAMTWWATSAEKPGTPKLKPAAVLVPAPSIPAPAPLAPVVAAQKPTLPVILQKVSPPTAAPAFGKPETPIIRTALKTDHPAPRARDAKYESILSEGEDAFRHNQLLQATMLAEKAIAIAPSVDAYLLIGKVFLHRDMPVEAAAAYRKALKLERGNAKAARGLTAAQTAARAAAAP